MNTTKQFATAEMAVAFDEAYRSTGSADEAACAAVLVAPYGVWVHGPFGSYRVTRRGRVRYTDSNGTVTVPWLSERRRRTAQAAWSAAGGSS
jgi:hypothetical protein